MADLKYEIKKNIGVVSVAPTGWQTELYLVSWGGANQKYDLRSWSPNHEKPSKGLTLTADELVILHRIIDEEVKRMQG